MVQKSQSALEFITTYGFVIIIMIAIIAVLFVFFSLPRNALPNRCNIYGALNCLDIAYSANTQGPPGSLLVFAASDAQPGFMNIQKYTATVDDPSSANGICTPSIVSDGENVICVIVFSTHANNNQVYTGNGTVSVIYCPKAKTASDCSSASQGSQLSFGLSFQVHASPPFKIPTTSISTITSTTITTTTSTSSTSTSSTSTSSTSTSSTSSSSTSTSSTSSSSTSTSSTSTSSTSSTTSTITTYYSCTYCVDDISVYQTPPATYYAPILSNNAIGIWTGTTPLPIPGDGSDDMSPSCILSNGYVYCVGGGYGPPTYIPTMIANAVYAQVTSSGIGTWIKTTPYPKPAADQDCVTANSYIYCVGGIQGSAVSSGGTTFFNYASSSFDRHTYSAPLSSSGIGTWTESSVLYPATFGAPATVCTASSSDIYCVGGVDTEDNDAYLYTDAYYAPISSGTIGTWTKTTSYPFPMALASCVTYNSYIYCIGGYDSNNGNPYGTTDVYYARILSSGAIGTWTKTTPYPLRISQESCIAYNGYISCIGGYISNTGESTDRLLRPDTSKQCNRHVDQEYQ